MAGPYITSLAGICKLVTATPTAFCAPPAKGTLTLDTQPIIEEGVGGMKVIKGEQKASLDLDCYGVLPADLALWFPTTPGIQVAAFPDFLCEIVGGAKFTFTECQPGSAEIAIDAAENSIFRYKLKINGIATEGTAGASATAVYTAAGAFTRQCCTVTYGASKLGTRSISIKNGLDSEGDTTLDGGATTGHMTEPESIRLKMGDGPSISVATETELPSQQNADAYTNSDVTVTLANGTAGDNVTITATDMIYPNRGIPMEGGDGVIVFTYDFRLDSGSKWGRVTFA